MDLEGLFLVAVDFLRLQTLVKKLVKTMLF